jgi:hypothetical protein
MKIKHQKIFITALLFIPLLYSSCKSFVEIDSPKSQLSDELTFENIGTTTAALAGVYSQLRFEGVLAGSSNGLNAYLSCYADEMINYSTNTQSGGVRFYTNILISTSSEVSGLWNTTYNQIYKANAIIEGVASSNKLTATDKNQVTGEALFIRAMLHFYLVNLFGDVPYIKQTDHQVNRNQSRLAVSQVYQLILTDLLASEQLLSDDYPSAERFRANKWVVKALLSRVYLYMEDWENTDITSASIIAHTSVYKWTENLNEVFLKESKGTIWAFAPISTGRNTDEGANWILVNSPVPNRRSLTPSLMNAFEPDDKRLQVWVGRYSRGTDNWFFSYKYKERGITTATKEYAILFRLEEQYLIRAEARAQLNNVKGAQDDLNKIRGRAGLNDTKAANTADLLEAILKERRIELFSEGGHRWFDLKRMGKANAVLGLVKPNWNPEDILLPIPESEILVNPNLKPQNPGY